MSRLYFRVGYVAAIAGLMIGAELHTPDFWLLTIDMTGLIVDKCIDAYRWVGAFFLAGWIGWKASEHVTRRDTLQEVAQKTAKSRLRESIHQLERPGNN